jgi:hypothetical protein
LLRLYQARAGPDGRRERKEHVHRGIEPSCKFVIVTPRTIETRESVTKGGEDRIRGTAGFELS